MKKSIFPQMIMAALFLSSCVPRIVRGSGLVVSEVRQVSEFSRVQICCGMELYLDQSERERLEIEAEDNILAEIESVVRGGTLWIQFQDAFPEAAYRPNRPIRIYMTVNDIESIKISGGGKLFAQEINAGRLEMVLSGGSDAEFEELQADTFDLDVSGGGRVTVAGKVTGQLVDASGGSNYDAAEFQSEEATLHISGGGNARLWASEILRVDASGGSNVGYFGTPTLHSETSGGSEIAALGEP